MSFIAICSSYFILKQKSKPITTGHISVKLCKVTGFWHEENIETVGEVIDVRWNGHWFIVLKGVREVRAAKRAGKVWILANIYP